LQGGIFFQFSDHLQTADVILKSEGKQWFEVISSFRGKAGFLLDHEPSEETSR